MKKETAKADLARERARIIMQVQSGILNATEAARKLGVSRKTYYKWEKRGLAALLDGLSDQTSGRSGAPEPVKRETELESKIAELEKRNNIIELQLGLKTLVHELEMDMYQQRTKKKQGFPGDNQ
jgi:transposase